MRETRACRVLIASMLASITLFADVQRADACGCVSPPSIPTGNYAVNQRAEQIIFETEPGWVTAHVLIKYSGSPESFAWLIPVPEIPELGVTPVSAFALIDNSTSPNVTVTKVNDCPVSEWQCRYHEPLRCGGNYGDDYGDNSPPGFADAASGGNGSGDPPVTVINTQRVGDYQTVTFRADQATAATQWLRDNGFVVNPTTSIYMEPYIQANMVFVAAKLVAGAGIDAIRPLKLRYRASYPMVPLVLTAVASDPNLTVTSFIYGDQPYRPQGHPVVSVDETRIAQDSNGRVNYPMVLARTIDEGGGDAFVTEYRGGSLVQTPTDTGCCSGGSDFCNLGNNSLCECPFAPFDQSDCGDIGDLVDGIDFVTAMSNRHSYLTRLTTRVSAEEMTFDPQFEPDFGGTNLFGRLNVNGTQHSLDQCRSAVIDQGRFTGIEEQQECSAVYCGPGGRCVNTESGPACACDSEHVAQRYTDLDNQPSVACVPTTPPVDLRAGGDVLPDACAGVSCGEGSCIDRNGVAVCECEAGTAAIAGSGASPTCLPVTRGGTTPGAQDFSDALSTLDVCAPTYPACSEGGWLEKGFSYRPGVACAGVAIDPPHSLTVPGPAPECNNWLGCEGCNAPSNNPVATFGAAWFVGAVLLRRRRRGARR